jgi:terminase large subunit-like protein
MPLSEPQKTIANDTSRHRVAACGRRFGKSHLSIREMARFASVPDRRVWYVSPTYRMCKQILWQPLKKRLFSVRWVEKVNEADLTILLRNGSTISLRGADNPDSLRGVGLDFLVVDEAADVREETWTQVLSPTLSDTGGHVLFCGTPKGRNWFYDLWMRGQDGEPGWRSWQYTTLAGGNVPAEEVEARRRDLDELSFLQEYEASFVSFEGRAYRDFARATHCRPLAYDPRLPLIFSHDFNVEPGVACVIQEQRDDQGNQFTAVIGEVWIPRSSSTPAVCRKLAADWGHHAGVVKIYADATGGARGSARVAGSDLDLIKAELTPVFRDRLQMRVPAANPPERTRVNALNSRIKSASGEVRLFVDPVKAPHVVLDLEGVALLKGGSGELDKKSNPTLSHISDALGYYCVKEFPLVRAQVGMGRWEI